MQILRFEDAPEVAPKRKKSSAGWIGLGLAAALFGVSTAFASSSIRINNEAPINLAQGVVAVTGCDSFIGLDPVTILKKDMKNFALKELVIGSAYDDGDPTHVYTIDTTPATDTPGGCGGVDFKLQFYPEATGATPVPVSCVDLIGTQGGYGAINGYVDLKDSPNIPNGLKCIGDAFYFRVARTTETLQFTESADFDPALFSYITLETTNETYAVSY